jgi:uncharacterized protein
VAGLAHGGGGEHGRADGFNLHRRREGYHRAMRALLAWALLVMAAVVALAWLLQRRLLYFPAPMDQAVAEGRAAALGLEPWREDDPAAPLHGWLLRTPGARGTLVVFHGNAGSALDRVYVARAFARASPALPLDVFLVEYPGYGPRAGTPSQAAMLASAREAIAAARREVPYGAGPLFVLGESLGSAVAALAAAAAPGEVDGLILVTPLASVPAVAARHYPGLPGWLVRDAYRADRALTRFGGPVAFVLAGRDEVVFTDLGQALFDARTGPKALWVDPRATHNTVDWSPGAPTWREAVTFAAGPRR